MSFSKKKKTWGEKELSLYVILSVVTLSFDDECISPVDIIQYRYAIIQLSQPYLNNDQFISRKILYIDQNIPKLQSIDFIDVQKENSLKLIAEGQTNREDIVDRKEYDQ